MTPRPVKFESNPSAAEIVALAKHGEPFVAPWWVGYLTRGRTYIIASQGFKFDDDKDRDKVAITMWGQVVPLDIAVDPEWVELLREAIAESKAVSR
jgi:hypothetical protein